MTTLKEVRFGNGLHVRFVDESNRYFGDYHRICVVATIVCKLLDLRVDSADDLQFRDQAMQALGLELKIVKRFERMGVPSSEVETVRSALVEGFLQNASSYLSRSEYPRSLVAAELKKRRTHRFYG